MSLVALPFLGFMAGTLPKEITMRSSLPFHLGLDLSTSSTENTASVWNMVPGKPFLISWTIWKMEIRQSGIFSSATQMTRIGIILLAFLSPLPSGISLVRSHTSQIIQYIDDIAVFLPEFWEKSSKFVSF